MISSLQSSHRSQGSSPDHLVTGSSSVVSLSAGSSSDSSGNSKHVKPNTHTSKTRKETSNFKETNHVPFKDKSSKHAVPNSSFIRSNALQTMGSTGSASIQSSAGSTFTNEIISTVHPTTSTKHRPSLKVIILAYMHTGSTYLASILQHHPDTFYQFEPLRSIKQQYTKHRVVTFLNNTARLVLAGVSALDFIIKDLYYYSYTYFECSAVLSLQI